MSYRTERTTSTRTKVAVTAGVVILAMAAACGDDSSPAANDDTDTATTTATVTPTATESSDVEPAKVQVPRVTGLPVGQARERMRARGLRVGTVSRRPSAKSKGTVLGQSNHPGSRLREGATVSLVIAAPLPVVPDTIGSDRSEARRELRRAGFTVQTKKQQTSSASPGTIVDQSPNGTRARPGTTVTLTVAVKPPAPPPSDEGDNCTPGYSTCLPPASDYDCAGGSGNGPEYAEGPISVRGSDPYDLDSDSDGVACE